ncbi:hypothetical protein ACVIIZ_005239 [Bradyrhizobium sp. USDA 4523]
MLVPLRQDCVSVPTEVTESSNYDANDGQRYQVAVVAERRS